MIGTAPEDFDGKHRFFNLVISAFEMTFDDEAEKSREAFVARKTGIGQDPFQLPPRGLPLRGSTWTGFEYIRCFQACTSV